MIVSNSNRKHICKLSGMIHEQFKTITGNVKFTIGNVRKQILSWFSESMAFYYILHVNWSILDVTEVRANKSYSI